MSVPIARGDIFEWESKYLGSITPSTTPCPDGVGVSPVPYVDLSGRNLTKAYLAGFDMTGANLGSSSLGTAYFANSTLSFANFSNADLSHISTGDYVRVYDANLRAANFSGAQIYGMYFDRSDLTNANFSGANLSGGHFNDATITGANFRNADWGYETSYYKRGVVSTANWRVMRDLHGIALGTVNLANTDMSNFNLAGTDFSQAWVGSANFTNANINSANFAGMDLGSAQLYSTASYTAKNLGAINLSNKTLSSWNFAGQSMASASFKSSQISCYFASANLTAADFGGASVISSTFTGANLAGARFNGAALSSSFAGANLTGADFTGATISKSSFDSLAPSQLAVTGDYQQKRFNSVGLSSIDLSGWDFSDFDLRGSTFQYATLNAANFSRANFGSINYSSASNFGSSSLAGADFSHAFLGSAAFNSSTLTSANFAGADLTAARFEYCDLSGADFKDAKLSSSHFFESSLANLDFHWQDFSSSYFSGTLTGANFADSIVARATFADCGTSGLSTTQLYSTGSYKLRDLRGITFGGDVSNWDFSNQNLTGAHFSEGSYDMFGGNNATVTGANFTDANIAGAYFWNSTGYGFSAQQLYSTASYKNLDLHGIMLGGSPKPYGCVLTGWDFHNQDLHDGWLNWANLSGANFRGARLTSAILIASQLDGTDFSLADLRHWYADGVKGTSITDNAILSNGTIAGLHLTADDVLKVRDAVSFNMYISVPIRVLNEMRLENGSTLKIIIHGGTWGSTITTDPGIPVDLGGTLDLGLDTPAMIPQLINQPVNLFTWTDPLAPGNEFDQILTDDRFIWDLSNLYSTGTIKVVHLKGDANDDGQVNLNDLYTLAINWRKSADAWDDADFNWDGIVDAKDLGILALNWQVGVENPSSASLSALATSLGLPGESVPEPSSSQVVLVVALALWNRKRARRHPVSL